MWKRNQNPARKIMTSKYERVTEGHEGEIEKPLWTSKSRSDCKKKVPEFNEDISAQNEKSAKNKKNT